MDVVLPSIVTDEDLPIMYSGAEAVLYTTLYEGFGLSVLEAMACGTPVVVSDIAPLRELCGDAALYAPPRDYEAFTDQILTVLSDKRERDRLSESGLARAAEYTWERTTELTIEVYEKSFEGA